jgi:hypothetical protein
LATDAGEWPREAFRRHGINYEVAKKAKSDLYRDVLPLINSGAVDLLDHDRLIVQLTSLERRTARGGRDTIDHGSLNDDNHAHTPVIFLGFNTMWIVTEVGVEHTFNISDMMLCSRQLETGPANVK